MATSNSFLKSRFAFWGGLVIGVVVLLCFLPLFHVVPLKAARDKTASSVFNAATFVESFWNEQLLSSRANAIDAGSLLEAIDKDPVEAAKRFGRRLGLSGTSSYFVSGEGRIVSVDGRSISIALSEKESTDVVINTGPVFGNAIRDGSGLLDVSDFPNSRDFNDISSEINRRVEEGVFPLLKEKAEVGATLRFVGGVEIADSVGNPSPLELVPVIIEFP